ncbi:hypothetical protein K7432_007165 [Basidiobolus ranarum]|uniref:SH3 domain-containing protein n=1 Tax=Basidiobolus ranarum TaxID=34480 RepID=A0ABR2W0I1_9FUNG
MTDDKSVDTSGSVTSINAYSSRVVSVVEAMSDYHGDEKFLDTLSFLKGDIIKVIEKKEDYFVGFLHNDMNKTLGRFPASLCKVHKSWLKEKWIETSQTPRDDSSSISSLDSEDFPAINVSHIVTHELPKYSMSAPTYIDIVI